ncbi:hypothetical protein DBV05_g2656 [Lasiodiplodia theobromae]|uniref:Myb-like domain-containing protein n=1 Tax=Lasiodiplodia theobromae TaxID=45133 RepID=A0A5N5DPD3_9PEZI|nr:hypothetical protein DBV05_g2656 [Lasiodiplodia theobromae]
MANFSSIDLNKIDPGWARKHKWTLWAAGLSQDQVRQMCNRPSFAEMAVQAQEKMSFDEALANAKEEGAKQALNKVAAENKAAQKAAAVQKSAKKETPAATTPAPAENTAASPENAAAPPKSEEKKGGSGKPNFAFTAEDDEKLLELKKANKSWKEIGQQLKKPQDALKNRFKEIGSDNQKASPQRQETKKAGRDKPAENPVPQHKTGEGEDWELQTVNEDDDPDSGEYMVIYPDSVFTEDICVAMARAMYEDYDNYYQRVASRIFDYTGKRVGVSAVRNKLAHARNKYRNALVAKI